MCVLAVSAWHGVPIVCYAPKSSAVCGNAYCFVHMLRRFGPGPSWSCCTVVRYACCVYTMLYNQVSVPQTARVQYTCDACGCGTLDASVQRARGLHARHACCRRGAPRHTCCRTSQTAAERRLVPCPMAGGQPREAAVDMEPTGLQARACFGFNAAGAPAGACATRCGCMVAVPSPGDPPSQVGTADKHDTGIA